jgi:hypothetical protein
VGTLGSRISGRMSRGAGSAQGGVEGWEASSQLVPAGLAPVGLAPVGLAPVGSAVRVVSAASSAGAVVITAGLPLSVRVGLAIRGQETSELGVAAGCHGMKRLSYLSRGQRASAYRRK